MLAFSTFHLLVVISSLHLVLANTDNCKSITIRKEVNDLTPEEMKTFKETIRKAIDTPDPDLPGESYWSAPGKQHEKMSPQIHNGCEFFFWHRMFLYTVEQKFQKLDPKFAFPYWDSSMDEEWKYPNWHNSVGLNITNLDDTKVKNKRSLQDKDLPSHNQWSNIIQTSIENGQGFNYFSPSPQAEYLHGVCHNYIGSSTGDMSTMHSPDDPAFYLHHAKLDYLWSVAQIQWADKNLPQVGCKLVNGQNSSLESPIPGYPNRFADALSLDNLCVKYANPGEEVTVEPTPTTTTPSAAITSVVNGTSITVMPTEPADYSSTRTAATRTRTQRSSRARPTQTEASQCFELPPSWLESNKLPPGDAQIAKNTCQKVENDVQQGVTFPPIPRPKPQEFSNVKVPEGIEVKPPAPPRYSDISSAVGNTGLSIFIVMVVVMI